MRTLHTQLSFRLTGILQTINKMIRDILPVGQSQEGVVLAFVEVTQVEQVVAVPLQVAQGNEHSAHSSVVPLE